jgi:hypothetical protein
MLSEALWQAQVSPEHQCALTSRLKADWVKLLSLTSTLIDDRSWFNMIFDRYIATLKESTFLVNDIVVIPRQSDFTAVLVHQMKYVIACQPGT